MFNNFFFLENCPLLDNVEKYCIAGQATDNNVNQHVRIVCWIPKATNKHSQHAILIAFHCNIGCINAPQYYIVLTMTVFLM